jgi:transposase-like protein
MQRRVFSREFKLEAVKLIKERGVAVAQAARDLGVAESVLRRWTREGEMDPRQAFPGRCRISTIPGSRMEAPGRAALSRLVSWYPCARRVGRSNPSGCCRNVSPVAV